MNAWQWRLTWGLSTLSKSRLGLVETRPKAASNKEELSPTKSPMIHILTKTSQCRQRKEQSSCFTGHYLISRYESCETHDLYSISFYSIRMPLLARKPCHIHRGYSSSLECSIGSSHILFFGFGGPSSAVLSLKVVPWASGSGFSAGFWLSSAIRPTCSDKLSAPLRAGCSGCCIFAP